MGRFATVAVFVLVGVLFGLWLVSDHYFLAIFMGGIAGLVALVIVRAFPRDRDYQNNGGDFFSPN